MEKSSKVVTCYFKWHFLIYMKKNCYDNGVSKIPNDICERGMLQGVFLDLHMTHTYLNFFRPVNSTN